MHVTVLKGHIDRVFYDRTERVLYLQLRGERVVHELRVSEESGFKKSIMLTKPDDDVVLHARNGRVDKWENCTLDASTVFEA